MFVNRPLSAWTFIFYDLVMRHWLASLGIFALGAVVTGCSTPSSLEPLSIPLEYERMVEAPEFPSLPECARLSAVEIEVDDLDDSIGTRWIEGNEDVTVPVTVTSDLGEWVRDGVEQALERAGVEIGSGGGPVMRVTIDQIVTRENVLRRAGYDSEIEMTVSLASGGSQCWSGQFEGQDGNYGYAGNAVAYHEMLNEALDVAMIDLFDDSGFEDAVCSCGN